MNPFDKIPSAYKFTLKQLSTKTGKPEHHLLIMALDDLNEKFRHSLLNTEPSITHQSTKITHHLSSDYCLSQLEIIPKDSQLGILLRSDQGIFITKHTYKNLVEALTALSESASVREKWIWTAITGNYPVVIAQKKPSHTPHLWLGQNTACKMFNSHSNNPRQYSLTTTLPMQKMCKICISNYNHLKNSHLDIKVVNEIIVGPLYDNALF